MKVHNPNLTSVVSGTSQAQGTGRTGRSGQSNGPAQTGSVGTNDDIHLSELVRSLRSLAADSPERQTRIEQIARDYASGNYKVDANATASKIIDESVSSNEPPSQ